MVHVDVSKREGLINSLCIEFWTEWSQLKPGKHQNTVFVPEEQTLYTQCLSLHRRVWSQNILRRRLERCPGPTHITSGDEGKISFRFFFKSFGILRNWMYIKKNYSDFLFVSALFSLFACH